MSWLVSLNDKTKWLSEHFNVLGDQLIHKPHLRSVAWKRDLLPVSTSLHTTTTAIFAL